MDLFLSAQSVGLAAFVTAGCMVAGGLLAQARARRRLVKLREAPQDTTPVEALLPGKRVLVAGTLKVRGSCCQRLEDAMPVAATTFEQRKREVATEAMLWCDRAKHLRIDVGTASIIVDGPVHVLLGADELYPACAIEQLRGRVTERVLTAERKATTDATNTPRYGVFRSVGHGDQVVVAGIVEPFADGDGPASYRRPGGSWCLRPDETGTIRLWSRRRPRVRGAFGAISAYATAILW
jgi:hypothetical protein